jgi:integrase
MKITKVEFTDLQLGSTEPETPVAFFTREQVHDIIAAAEEPFKTLFSLARYTGCRAGELLALTLPDLRD